MRIKLFLCSLLSATVLGCAPSSDSSVASNSDASPTTEATTSDVGAMMTKEADASTPSESQASSEWLPAPEGVSDQLSKAYSRVVDSLSLADEQAFLMLANYSQRVAGELNRIGKADDCYEFYLQAAKALRKAKSLGGEQIPAPMASSIFYNEACALAMKGKTEEAQAALESAFENGFSNLQLLETDTDLDSLRSSPGFKERLAEWKRQAKERAIALARQDLDAGETFPFTFASVDIDGNEQSLEALKGKVVIVDVWGTWCPPCRAEVPSFIKLQEKYGDQGLQMIGLNYERKETEEENLKAVVDFIAETGINYPCIMGEKETRDQIPEFRGYPTTLFIDRTGTVRMKAVGLHEYDYLDAVVSVLLEE